ncbi:exonuclease domain-containing protein [Dactylosporangium sp. NPDC000244]|uniref:exonuclease domain-containing protein n=1 Tax=Dactylosporangium sp. NPDC000244 TaxID=3154365 RepID=UPI00332B59E2
MTGWHAQRLCTFDLESTAPDPEEARIVTACIAMVGGGRSTEVSSWVADPGVEVPAGAAEVHGYTTERVRAEGKPLADVLPEIVGTLATAIAAHLPVVIYNAPYDTTLLDRETRRFDLPPFGDLLAGAQIIDPLCIDRALDRYRKGKRTLTAACEHYGVRLDGAHDSTFDALAAARIAWTIGQRSHMTAVELRQLYADRRRPDEIVRAFHAFSGLSLDALQGWQAERYRESSLSLADYWRDEALKLSAQADRDEPPALPEITDASPDERRQLLREQAAELVQRADSVRTEWPFAAVAP